MMEKAMGAFLRSGQLVLHGCSYTTAGICIEWQPVFVIDCHSSPQLVGELARRALDATKIDVPHPTKFDYRSSPVAKALKIRSWRALMRAKPHCCHIHETQEKIIITPWKREGLNFVGDENLEKICIPPDASAEALGRAILEGLRRAAAADGEVFDFSQEARGQPSEE